MLALGGAHRMYWEESGRRDGAPVLFLHGGPGAGASPGDRRFFDPAHYRIIVFDQRGAGRSRPLGALEDNTTPHLVADIETLREFLGIDRWILFGGSWGAALALAYAEEHPERCRALALRGVFLCRKGEIDWFLHGVRRFFPERLRSFAGHLPPGERGDLLAGYHARLTDPDPRIHMPAARAWSRYEGACSTLLPNPAAAAEFERDDMALGLARIEAHYFVNRIFLPENALLDRAGRLAGIPGRIVQGRYDMVCPPTAAATLAAAWPDAETVVVEDAGHSATEPGTARALVSVMDRLRGLEP